MKSGKSTKNEGVIVPRVAITIFFEKFDTLLSINDYSRKLTFNIDEIWISFKESNRGLKVINRNNKDLIVKEGSESMHFTAIVCISVEGRFIPVKNLSPYKIEKILLLSEHDLERTDCVYSPSGWMNQEQLLVWAMNVYLLRVNKIRYNDRNQRGILILDGHSLNCICCLQPLDLVIFGPFKRFLKTYFVNNNRYSLLDASESAFSETLIIKKIRGDWERIMLINTDHLDGINRYRDIEIDISRKKLISVSNQILTDEDFIEEL